MGSLRLSIEEKFGAVPYFLIYAILEWVVIMLLFIDGFLAFISNEIAEFFELRIPCLLCTRLDHILVHRDSNFYYNDSICEAHKKDISTLTYCHMHKKLSDIHSMCQGCLISFASDKDSDCGKYKSLVGILHKDVDSFVEDERRLLLKPLRKDDMEIVPDEKIGVFRCCCCGESLKPKSSSKFTRSLSMNAPAPSPRASWLQGRSEESGNMDLPHVRYTELKLSDTDFELNEDEDNHGIPIAGREDGKDTMVSEEMNDGVVRTPRGNKFFGIPLSDAVSNRSSRKLVADKLDLLLMELDEERSAAAIAANNAMAMITRLQTEKAAVQMEALQYQRMMEEQAEYDQEALQMMRDLIFKREEDIKALESELEIYREKYGPIKKIGSEICEFDVEDDYQDMHSQALSSFSEKSCSSVGADQNEYTQDELCMDFESDRSYLLGLLSDLENKINEDEENKDCSLTREVSLIRERLRAVEAENSFLKHAAMTLQRGGEGTKLLIEIAQHLRKLRLNNAKSSLEDVEAEASS